MHPLPPVVRAVATPSASPSPPWFPIDAWSVVWVSFVTILPWAVVSVWDAIDSTYRSKTTIVLRLWLSSTCNLVAYVVGILFVRELVVDASKQKDNGRFDEIATFLVLLFFNLWFVLRNIRGWLQFAALYRLVPLFHRLQAGFALAATRNQAVTLSPPLMDGMAMVKISDRLIDNDLNTLTPFLNPVYPNEFHWQLAAWRAWWSQDCSDRRDLAPGRDYDVSASKVLAQDLPEDGPRWPANAAEKVYYPRTRDEIPRDDRERWMQALVQYGDGKGQQDSAGPADNDLFGVKDRSGIATLVYEKTRFQPHRMNALWYCTAKFEDMYAGLAADINQRKGEDALLMPESLSMWKEIASDIARHLREPMYLNGEGLSAYASELASSSILLTHFPSEFSTLVETVYQDGRSARWTFGWSGLLSCFSNLWTRQRVFVSMLNGLSLLAIKSANSVDLIEPCVRAMLVGYASFAVSNRAIGKHIAQARKAELLARYRDQRGNTCRGSGLCSTRVACRVLGIPAAASHMDGLPAFATGWAMEFMEARPGSQMPEHGGNHNEVEEREGSSSAWRYPEAHI